MTSLISILISILIALAIAAAIFITVAVLGCVAVNFASYKSYRKTYEMLKSGKLVIAFETPELIILNEEGEPGFAWLLSC